MVKVTCEMARTMAQWWGDKISGNTHHDNGDHDNLASVFAGLLADTMNKQADGSQIDKFVDILTEKILKQAEENPFALRHKLDCDYGPSKFLSDAAKEAGISPNNFPWKTCMGIWEKDDGTVDIQVSAGYRAPWVKIWPVQEPIEQETIPVWKYAGTTEWKCPECGTRIDEEIDYCINRPMLFCPHCGKPVCWPKEGEEE